MSEKLLGYSQSGTSLLKLLLPSHQGARNFQASREAMFGCGLTSSLHPDPCQNFTRLTTSKLPLLQHVAFHQFRPINLQNGQKQTPKISLKARPETQTTRKRRTTNRHLKAPTITMEETLETSHTTPAHSPHNPLLTPREHPPNWGRGSLLRSFPGIRTPLHQPHRNSL